MQADFEQALQEAAWRRKRGVAKGHGRRRDSKGRFVKRGGKKRRKG
jgi:hypothetical protein